MTTPEAGHNSGDLSPEDRRILLFHHVNAIGRIDDEIAELRARRNTKRKEAKADGFELGVEIDQALRIRNAEDASTVAAAISKRVWVARAFGLDMAEQLDLFGGGVSTDSIQRAFDAGYDAGIRGADPKPPVEPGAEFNAWMEGWHKGQEKVRALMQRRMEAANAAASETAGSVTDDGDDVRPRFLKQDGAASDSDPFAPAA